MALYKSMTRLHYYNEIEQILVVNKIDIISM